MIYLEEKTSSKVPGLTSIYITFKYNPQVIDILKTCEGYHYNKSNYTWEVCITNLSHLLDELVYLDDISLKILAEEEPRLIKRVVEYKTKPFQYQLDAIEYGLQKDKWLLLDSPGLGKTMTIIDLAEELHIQRQIEHCLVICGVNSLKSNWKREIQKHSHLDCMILGERITKTGNITYGSVKDRVDQLKHKIEEFFIITNVETIRDSDILKALEKGTNKIDMIVIDEIHRCKDPSSIQGKNLLKLNATYKIGLTGTILKNNPLDAYVPLKWTNNINCSLTNFKSYFCTFGGFTGYQVTGFKHMDFFKDILSSCSLRRTKDLLDLPSKNIINEVVSMSDAHKKFYDSVTQGVKEDVDKVKINTTSLRAMIIRLRQATACPEALTTQKIMSSKVERAVDLVHQLLNNNEKVVIFSTFKDTCYTLGELLKEEKPLILTGDCKPNYIDDAVVKFQSDMKYKVLIATWQCMGTGHSLHQQCSYAIFMDTPWTHADYLQCQDRVHRIGSTKPVFIYNLICENTVDELVASIVDRKEAISDFIVDDKASNKSMEILAKYIADL